MLSVLKALQNWKEVAILQVLQGWMAESLAQRRGRRGAVCAAEGPGTGTRQV